LGKVTRPAELPDQTIRLSAGETTFLLCADASGRRLVIFEDGDSARQEVASLAAADVAEVRPFIDALAKALRQQRESLPSDPGPLQRFQPPPDEQ
jgi:hypothetical protein